MTASESVVDVVGAAGVRPLEAALTLDDVVRDARAMLAHHDEPRAWLTLRRNLAGSMALTGKEQELAAGLLACAVLRLAGEPT